MSSDGGSFPVCWALQPQCGHRSQVSSEAWAPALLPDGSSAPSVDRKILVRTGTAGGREEGILDLETRLGKLRSALHGQGDKKTTLSFGHQSRHREAQVLHQVENQQKQPQAKPFGLTRSCENHQQRALCQVSPFSGWMQGQPGPVCSRLSQRTFTLPCTS